MKPKGESNVRIQASRLVGSHHLSVNRNDRLLALWSRKRQAGEASRATSAATGGATAADNEAPATGRCGHAIDRVAEPQRVVNVPLRDVYAEVDYFAEKLSF